jgi:hypothetical protein
MIAAGHEANYGIAPLVVSLPHLPGTDLASTVERVGSWGGDKALYQYFLGRALVEARDAASARSIAVVAGWRAGVVALRTEALAQLDPLGRDTAAAALGLAPDQLADFRLVQTRSCFGFPQQRGVIARIGGFAGMGGPWIAPPTSAHLAGDGIVAIACGDELWVAHADAFGSRLSRVDALPPAVANPAWPAIEVSPTSYLVSVVQR